METMITVIKGGKLIDGTGAAPIENAVLVIKDGQIMSVGPAGSADLTGPATVIDATGQTVMPGLIDAHLHLFGIKSINPVTWVIDNPLHRAMRAALDAWKVVDAGFTAVRDAGGLNGLYLKRAVEEGSIIGPRIMAAGRVVSQTAGHGDIHMVPIEFASSVGLGRVADGVGECRKAVREQLREGADFIKIMTTGGVMSEKDKPTACQFSMEEIRAMVEEARNAGVRIASHAQGTNGIKNALFAGVDSIEHGICLDDECIELMVKQGSYLVPTLAIVDALVTKGPKFGLPAVNLEKARSVQEVHIESVKRARAAGVKIGLATDYLTDPLSPMGENAVELDLYVNKIGFTPMEAIVCATKVNSEVLALQDKIGTLEPGKLADLLIVKGDPLKDIRILRDKTNIVTILKGGVPVPRLNL